MMKVLRVVLLGLFSGSVVGEDFSAVNDTPADISFTALLLSQERKGTAVLAQELVNEGSLSLSATDIVAIRAELCGGLTNSMKFYLYAVEDDGSETLLREQTENFQPFTVFGKTPPDVYKGSADFERFRTYVLRAETYLLREAEGEVQASTAITFKVESFESKVTASDAADGYDFGEVVATSGDDVVVGSPADDRFSSRNGSAYVYSRAGRGWSQVATLTAGVTSSAFGSAAATSRVALVVGAPFDVDAGVASGSAYVVLKESRLRPGELWSQAAKLTASDAAFNDRFGSAVAVDGDTLVVGAPTDDDPSNSGAAYVFKSDNAGLTWSEVAKLKASDAAEADLFGASVAISGGTIVIGAYSVDGVGTSSGSAYVFQSDDDGETWSDKSLKLTAGDAATFDNFGAAVAVDGDTIVVGAHGDDDPSNSGAAYVFQRDGKTWPQVAKLKASDAAEFDLFGGAVAVAGDTVVVGSPADDDAGSASGSTYVFRRLGLGWSQVAKFTATDANAGDNFGSSVAIDGDTLVAGAPRVVNDQFARGSAYVLSV